MASKENILETMSEEAAEVTSEIVSELRQQLAAGRSDLPPAPDLVISFENASRPAAHAAAGLLHGTASYNLSAMSALLAPLQISSYRGNECYKEYDTLLDELFGLGHSLPLGLDIDLGHWFETWIADARSKRFFQLYRWVFKGQKRGRSFYCRCKTGKIYKKLQVERNF